MTQSINLMDLLRDRFAEQVLEFMLGKDAMVTLEVLPQHLRTLCCALKEESPFKFDMLIDVSGVDYLDYGQSQWRTQETTLTGFSRAVQVQPEEQIVPWNKPRFAAVYHLLSTSHNQRVRLRVFADGEPPLIPSVVSIWSAANWYEREAFDLYGIIFDGHPDLRRLLTDYGFIGHPFRKDFPLIGEVELRYDAKQRRCVYEPVSIRERVLVPKVIREDNRYFDEQE